MDPELYDLLIESMVISLLEEPQVGATPSTVATLEGRDASFVRTLGRQLVKKLQQMQLGFQKRGQNKFDLDLKRIVTPDRIDALESGKAHALKEIVAFHRHASEVARENKEYASFTTQAAPRSRDTIVKASSSAIKAGVDRARSVKP